MEQMTKITRTLSTILTAVMMAGLMNVPAFAARKINSISLVVENNIQVGEKYSTDDISIMTKGENYVVGDIEIINDGYEWENTDIPKIEVSIEALDGYFLSVPANGVKLKGATYIKGQKVDSQTILLTLELPSLREIVGAVEKVGWESNQVATWNSAFNAGAYEVKLYRDNNLVKSTKKTKETRMDFSSMMTKSGTYQYRVRAINVMKEDNKSEWVESGTVYIDEETANRLRTEHNGVPSGFSEPSQVIASKVKDGWNQDGIGWWYRNTDGGYTTDNWQEIDGKWYFFNSRGYMQTGWILWKYQYYYCDDTSGEMLVNTVTPDGKRVDSQGVLIS